MGALILSCLCYVSGMGAIAGLFWFMQFGLDRAPEAFSAQDAIFNLLLFLIFPLQHSILARRRWKDWIQRKVHPLLERPIYVGLSGMALGVVLWLWRPVGPLLFKFTPRYPFDLLFALSLALILRTSIALGHLSLFGIKQGIAMARGLPFQQSGLVRTGIFALVRHPLTTLLILAVWAHHVLTAGRLEWNLLVTAYSLVGVYFEERDLVALYGDEYRQYRSSVPAFIPSLKELFGTPHH